MNPLNHNLPDEESIEACAAAWLAQREEGFTSEQAAAFEAWWRADPRHAAATARLEEGCGFLGRMALFAGDGELRRELTEPSVTRPEGRVRRVDFRWLAALAAVLVVGVALWQFRPASAPFVAGQVVTYTTTEGGYQRVILPDGTVAELNAGTQLRVQFSAQARRVVLPAGEAYFSVLPEAGRVFRVEAMGVSIEAARGAFNIRLRDEAIEVFVAEGTVAVSGRGGAAAGGPGDFSHGVAAGQRWVLAPRNSSAPAVEAVSLPIAGETLAWQAPRLVFADTPLGEAIVRFNRFNDTQLTLGEGELASHPVRGVFRANDPDAFVKALETSGGFVAERVTQRASPSDLRSPLITIVVLRGAR